MSRKLRSIAPPIFLTMKIKNLVELLSTLDPDTDIRTQEKWDPDEDAIIMDVVDVVIEKQLMTGITHAYLLLGCEDKQQPVAQVLPEHKTVAVPPRPYRASD